MEEDRTPSAKELFCKTRICKFYAAGRCKQGRKCTFAHGAANMAPRPDFYHTRMCPSLLDTGVCENGEGCTYAHSKQELRTGVTKSTSNAAKLATLPTLTNSRVKVDLKPHSLQPGTTLDLQQVLFRYGIPEAPAKLSKSHSLPDQPYFRHEEISVAPTTNANCRRRGKLSKGDDDDLIPTPSCIRRESAITEDFSSLLDSCDALTASNGGVVALQTRSKGQTVVEACQGDLLTAQHADTLSDERPQSVVLRL